MELNQYILQEANAKGICSEWAEMIGAAESKEELMEMYVKGIDFCLDHNFPSNYELLHLGGSDFLAKYGVHLISNCDNSDIPFLVLLGDCSSTSKWGGYSASQAYVKNNASLDCEVKGNAMLVIDCFDDSIVHVAASEESKVLINIYGNAKVTTTKNGNAIIKIVNKLKNKY